MCIYNLQQHFLNILNFIQQISLFFFIDFYILYISTIFSFLCVPLVRLRWKYKKFVIEHFALTQLQNLYKKTLDVEEEKWKIFFLLVVGLLWEFYFSI